MKPSTHATASSQIVTIEKPIYGGQFLARLEGKAVFVPLALPGEQVRVRVAEGKRGYATAQLEELLVPSAERIAPECAHFGQCGGCDYQHTGYAQQLALKQAVLRETLTRAAVTPPEQIDVLAGEPWGYRNRIRLAVDGAGKLGYRGRGSHRLIPLDHCPIAAPVLIDAARHAESLLPARLAARELSLFTNHDGSELWASLLAGAPARAAFEHFAAQLRQRVPSLVAAELQLEARSVGRKPAPFPQTIATWGERALQYRAAGREYRVDLGAFFQVNRWLIDALVERVTEGAEGGVAWDLFAGVGLFARVLAEGFEQVVAVESAPAATAALEENLDRVASKAIHIANKPMGAASRAIRATTAEFLRRATQTAAPGPARPDFIVVDPPRAGLGSDVTAALGLVAAPAMVYVSCDPATLARDLRQLLDAGYSIERMAMADLFPHTFHLETVVHLRHC